MPLYEYDCQACHHRFERIQRVSAPPVQECPSCGGEVRRLLSAPALQFKGSGWYVTDYGKGSGNGARPSKDAAKSADNGSSSKGESESAGSSSKESSATDASSGSGASTKGGADKAAAAG